MKNRKKYIPPKVSLLEKEMRTLQDKKIVSGILWKRLAINMPLQLDATINYITNRSDPSVAIKHTKIDSPYNTYLRAGLPPGPISSPNKEAINAVLNATPSPYWFYLSDPKTGKTIFSETLDEQSANRRIYLRQ